MATASVPENDNRDLECPVCHEVFRTPKMLPCGHTLCLAPCLQQLAKDKDGVRCPECRTEHQLPGGSVDSFPTNILIVRMMKKETAPPKPRERCCPICAAEDLLVKCFHCTILICENCREKHTQELKTDVAKVVDELKNTAEGFNLDELEDDTRRKLRKGVEVFCTEIEEASASMVEAVLKRKEALLQQVRSYEEKESIDISQGLVVMKVMLKDVGDFCRLNCDLDTTQGKLLNIQSTSFEKNEMLLKMKASVNERHNMLLKVSPGSVLSDIQTLGSFERQLKPLQMTEVIPSDSAPILHQEQKQCTNVSADAKSSPCLSPAAPPVYVTPVPVQSLCDRDCQTVKSCIGRFGNKNGQFKDPTCLTVCPMTGNIVVGDNGNGRLQLFDDEGKFIKTILKKSEKDEKKNFDKLRALATDMKGTIIALDASGIHVYTKEGEHSITFKYREANNMALDSKGHIHLCYGEYGVYVRKQNGAFISNYDCTPGVPFEAHQIAIDNQNICYVTDVDKDMAMRKPHYFVFNSVRQLIRWGDLDCPFEVSSAMRRPQSTKKYFPAGKMIIIENKYFLVPDASYHHVRLFDMQWKLLKSVGTEGYCCGQLHKPTGADITKKGELVVISENCMLQFF